MLCQLSYRGMLQERLYGLGLTASSSGGDGTQGLFKLLNLRLEHLLLIVIRRLPLTALPTEYPESQPGFAHGALGRKEPLPHRGEGADLIHQRPGPFIQEHSVEILARIFFQQSEDPGVGFVAEILGTQREGLGQRWGLYAVLEEGRREIRPGEDEG